MNRQWFWAAALSALLFVSPAHAQEALPNKAPEPAANPSTPEKVELGKQLFFDPRLSADGTVSCNSCHNAMGGGEDNRSFSAGVGGKLGGRSAPTVWNSAFNSVQFWDGRAASLEEQAKGPMTNPVEMAMKDHDVVVARLKDIPGYVDAFKKVFGDKDPVTIDNAVKAIAAYERTLITPNARFDRFIKGDKTALTDEEQKGFQKVQEVGCTSCHAGPNFSGPTQPEGQGFFMKFPTFPSAYDAKYELTKDLGRFEVTKAEEDKNMWRVPTWRNIALTAPYFHNGSVATLDEAVKVMAKSQLDKDLTDEDVTQIVAFLKTLNGEMPKQTMPQLPPTEGRSLVPVKK